MKGKKLSILVSALLIILLSGVPVFAADVSTTEPYIETTASGEVEAEPDIAYLNFQIRTEADSSETAQQNNAKAVTKAIDLLVAKGIARDEIYTTYYNSYSYTKTEVRPLAADGVASLSSVRPAEAVPPEEITETVVFVTESTLRVTVKNIAKVGSLLTDLATIPEVRVNGVEYALQNVLQYKREAISRAISEARQTIDYTADALDVELAGLRNIRVDFNSYYYGPVYAKEMYAAADEGAGIPQPQNPQKIKVTASVYLAYNVK